MTFQRCVRAARRAHQLVTRRAQGRGEGGFILLESVIAITVITIVMAAVGAEFVGGMIATSQQRAQQGAVQIASSTVDQVRALDPTDLVTGRTSASVDAQFAQTPGSVAVLPDVKRLLDQMEKASDNSGASPIIPAVGVPTNAPGTPGSWAVTYTVNQYLGWCSIVYTKNVLDGVDRTKCEKPPVSSVDGTNRFLRVVVAVTWKGPRCGSPMCVFVTSTLLESTPDEPTFRIDAQPYAAPELLPTSATNIVGDRLGVEPGDKPRVEIPVKPNTGVRPLTFRVVSGSLPTDVKGISSTGFISGVVQEPNPASPITAPVTVTVKIQAIDAFDRPSNTVDLTWIIKPALMLKVPEPAPTDVRGKPVNPRTLTALYGAGPEFTYSILNNSLPPGLILTTKTSTTAEISGTPTAVGTYTVSVKVFDKDYAHSDIETFTWTITNPPITPSNPGNQVDTINAPISPIPTLTARGGSDAYTWSDPSGTLPNGIRVSPTGELSGTPTALTSGSGRSVVLTVTDSTGSATTVSFMWSVVAKPTLTFPVTTTVTVGQSVSLSPVVDSCPNGPCSYTSVNLLAGLSVNAAGQIIGTVAATATTTTTITVTATDIDGASGTSAPFTIAVTAKPTVTAPANQTNTLGQAVNVAFTKNCPNSPCSYELNNGPTNLSAASGSITGTIGGTVKTYPDVTVTVTDAGGVAVTSSSFSWTVGAPPRPSLAGLASTDIGETATPSIPISYSCPAAPCLITLSGTLATSSVGLGLSTTAVTVTANGNRSVTVPDSSGTVYLNGLVSSSAGTSAGRSYGVSLDIVDSINVRPALSSVTFKAYSAPTISTPGLLTTAQNATPSKPLTYAYCATPTFSCAISVTGLPAGVGLSTNANNTSANAVTSIQAPFFFFGTVYLNGKVSASAAKRDYLVTVSITGSGTTVTSSGIWAVQ